MADHLDFYQEGNYNELINRLEMLQADAQPKWGSMHVGQMLQHLNRAIGVGLGHYDFKDESNFIRRGIVKYLVF